MIKDAETPGGLVRSSVPLEQYKALGGATVSVCYGLLMQKVTGRKRTDEYGREWMDAFYAPKLEKHED